MKLLQFRYNFVTRTQPPCQRRACPDDGPSDGDDQRNQRREPRTTSHETPTYARNTNRRTKQQRPNHHQGGHPHQKQRQHPGPRGREQQGHDNHPDYLPGRTETPSTARTTDPHWDHFETLEMPNGMKRQGLPRGPLGRPHCWMLTTKHQKTLWIYLPKRTRTRGRQDRTTDGATKEAPTQHENGDTRPAGRPKGLDYQPHVCSTFVCLGLPI